MGGGGDVGGRGGEGAHSPLMNDPAGHELQPAESNDTPQFAWLQVVRAGFELYLQHLAVSRK